MSLVTSLADLSECPEDIRDTAIDDCFSAELENRKITPYPAQEEAFLVLRADDHLILSTPTGSGKSLVAEYCLWRTLANNGQAYYTAPIKALVNEKFFQLCEVFGAENVGLITGDAAVNADAPLLCATAEILANKILREGDTGSISAVIMDEFHFVADPDRGWAWQIPLIELSSTQFVLMSATLGDTRRWKEHLEEHTTRSVTEVTYTKRPIPLMFEYSTSPINEKVQQLVNENNEPVYVVFFTQKEAVNYANQLKSIALIDNQRRRAIADAISGIRFSTTYGVALRSLLLHGVGVHHAGLLPKYRRLVERLAQQGLLAVICGTDTLGVGINVPIRTVLLSGLAKFDGHRQRLLNIREFQQLAGRAGRAGYDTQGLVVVQATEEEITELRATRRGRKPPKRKRQPGVVTWTQKNFDKLSTGTTEQLRPRFSMTIALLLHLIERPGSLYEHVRHLVTNSFESREGQRKAALDAFSHFRSLCTAGVVEYRPYDDPFDDGRWVHLTDALPYNLELNQPLAPFALEYLQVLDTEDDDYAVRVISLIEAILEDPRQLLYAQQSEARRQQAALLKEDGASYDEIRSEVDAITWPQPMNEELSAALAIFAEHHPWAQHHDISPKSVVREMYENGMTFGDLISRYSLSRAEGVILRYLSDFYRTAGHLLQEDQRTEELDSCLHWLRDIIERIDHSLLAEWEALAQGVPYSPEENDEDTEPQRPVMLSENTYLFTRLLRNTLFRYVELIAADRTELLDEMNSAILGDCPDWYEDTQAYWDEYDEILTDQDARSARFFRAEPSADGSTWTVQQTLCDPEGDYSWVVRGIVDIAATDEAAAIRFSSLEVRDLTDNSSANQST